jgi:hypothetical protein
MLIIMLTTGVLLCKDLDTNLDVNRYCLGSEMLTHCQLLTAIVGFVCSICFLVAIAGSFRNLIEIALLWAFILVNVFFRSPCLVSQVPFYFW